MSNSIVERVKRIAEAVVVSEVEEKGMAKIGRVRLDVSYEDKDDAKRHGARWNPEGKYWYWPGELADLPGGLKGYVIEGQTDTPDMEKVTATIRLDFGYDPDLIKKEYEQKKRISLEGQEALARYTEYYNWVEEKSWKWEAGIREEPEKVARDHDRDLEEPHKPLYQAQRDPAIEIVLTGNTYPVKDKLKERGYRFGEYEVGSGPMFLLMTVMRGGTKGWGKSFSIHGEVTIDAIKAVFLQVKEEIEVLKGIMPVLETAGQDQLGLAAQRIVKGEYFDLLSPEEEKKKIDKLWGRIWQKDKSISLGDAKQRIEDIMAEKQDEENNLNTFKVGTREDSVKVGAGGALTVQSTDGRVATGWLDGRDVIISEINGLEVSTSSALNRIEYDVAMILERRKQ